MIWLGTRQQLLKLDFAFVTAQFPQYTFLTAVCDLGVTLYNTLSQLTYLSYLDLGLGPIIHAAYVFSDTVFMPIFTSMVHAFVCYRVDYLAPFSLVYQNPAWLHFNLSLMRLLVC